VSGLLEGMTRDDAERIANDWLAEHVSAPCRVAAEHTRQVGYGWVFYWNSVAFLDRHDRRRTMIGNGPLLVLRGTGQVVPTGTAYDVDHYLRSYEMRVGLRRRPSRSAMLRLVLRDAWIFARGQEWSAGLEPPACSCLTCRCDEEPRPVGAA
jgi:hypothetical protein